MVGIAVGDENMGDVGPLRFRNQAAKLKQPEILTRIDGDFICPVFENEGVIEKMPDFHFY